MSLVATVRVYVADDHPLYRDGLVRALGARAEFGLVGVASDGRTALEAIRALQPDVAVLDVRMPELDGTDILATIQQEGLPTRVIIISAFTDGETVYKAVSLGAKAYLSKDADREMICEAVSAVAGGEARLDPQVQGALLQAVTHRDGANRRTLTPRERQIIDLVALGYSCPQIAGRLFLSVATVRTHVKNVYEKLEVGDRAAAVAEAMRRGLIR